MVNNVILSRCDILKEALNKSIDQMQGDKHHSLVNGSLSDTSQRITYIGCGHIMASCYRFPCISIYMETKNALIVCCHVCVSGHLLVRDTLTFTTKCCLKCLENAFNHMANTLWEHILLIDGANNGPECSDHSDIWLHCMDIVLMSCVWPFSHSSMRHSTVIQLERFACISANPCKTNPFSV